VSAVDACFSLVKGAQTVGRVVALGVAGGDVAAAAAAAAAVGVCAL
jgi:hypothetical protein